MSTLVYDAMLREAARSIAREGLGVTAEFIEAKSIIVLSLTEAPFSEIVLEIKKP